MNDKWFMSAVRYEIPKHWIKYNATAIAADLTNAKAGILLLTSVPYQRQWVEKLQEVQLKMEVAGTSRIEGAEFTENELDNALDPTSSIEEMVTRSQKQAKAAVETYRWISTLPTDYPLSRNLVQEIHRRIVTNCDDDHCAPGKLRPRDHNVTFGVPRHRGCEGGELCERAFNRLIEAANAEFKEHDVLIQALALHYHLAAMHPFADGNGRTARALESFMHRRVGTSHIAFIAVSNYYYDEKNTYLEKLSKVRASEYDLTEFLSFGLKGLAQQCQRILKEIVHHTQKALYRNTMYDLFNRLSSPVEARGRRGAEGAAEGAGA